MIMIARMLVALDIETTGFDTATDQLIEIAAIKFEGDRIIDQFTTLLNPGINIPPMIVHITGITDQDVAAAPAMSDIKDRFKNFIGDFPIVGHNIDFDVNFLNAKDLNLKNPLYDTLQLAGIVLTGLPSYSLDTLSRLLQIKHEQKHRALSDTIAAWKLFLILERKISEIDPRTRSHIQKIIQKSTWSLGKLFFEPF